MPLYKKIDNQTIVHAHQYVEAPTYRLEVGPQDPYDGWYYFESDEEAYTFFGVELPQSDSSSSSSF
jgi:translation initiation factor 2 alpha subunit (eIF-2alpha)